MPRPSPRTNCASAQIGQDVSQKAADELKQRLSEALRQKARKP
jgi:uncharacterized protein